MSSINYWLELFSWNTWQELLKDGGRTTGFKENQWRIVQQIKPGDYLLCYLTGVSRFIGILKVVSEAFKDHSPSYGDITLICRIKIVIICVLEPKRLYLSWN